jgi:hypothetical protein
VREQPGHLVRCARRDVQLGRAIDLVMDPDLAELEIDLLER